MSSAPGEKKGPPPVVQKVLSMFGSKREEDKMVSLSPLFLLNPLLHRQFPHLPSWMFRWDTCPSSRSALNS